MHKRVLVIGRQSFELPHTGAGWLLRDGDERCECCLSLVSCVEASSALSRLWRYKGLLLIISSLFYFVFLFPALAYLSPRCLISCFPLWLVTLALSTRPKASQFSVFSLSCCVFMIV